jgi:multidrug efflux system membrane fusion protein
MNDAAEIPPVRLAPRISRMSSLWRGGALLAIAAIATASWWRYSHSQTVSMPAPGLPQVVVSAPLQRELKSTLGFLGQFAAVEQVELRAQVGGTIMQIRFRDGEIVHKGDLLFVIDEVPYQIRLQQADAQLETAGARLELATRQMERAVALQRNDAGSQDNVDQRAAEQRAAQAAVDGARAQIRDARFDLDHCRISAPFTGRIGTHLVSAGNLIAGSRAAASPTTLLATLVSLDPIWLNFDMSESDYLAFARQRAGDKSVLAHQVEFALSDETDFARRGTLDFLDNVVDRSSGTLHARATIPNPGVALTPGEFARIRLDLGAAVPTLLVPDAAVLPDQSQHLVLTVAPDGTVTPKQVEVGDMHEGLRVIRSGLSATDRVIIEGLPYAAPGSKVTAHPGVIRFAANTNR